MELFVIFSPLVGAILAGFGWKIIGEKAALISATFYFFSVFRQLVSFYRF